jgi:uncharacterized protein
MMNQIKNQGMLLCVLFIFLSYLFSRSHYTLFFISLFGLLLLLVFFKEDNRLYAWVIISFFLANLILSYLDKFLDGYRLSPYMQVIISQLLYLIPILTLSYVIRKFKKAVSSYSQKPFVEGKIIQFVTIAVPFKRFLFFVYMAVSLGAITFWLTKSVYVNIKIFFSLVLFAAIYALLQEALWRGILMTQIIRITNKRTGILMTSIAYGINTTIFGFTMVPLLINTLLGILFGYLTVKSTSIIPAVIANMLVSFLLFFYGWLYIPI